MRRTRGSAPVMLGDGRDPVVHRPARTRASTIGRGEARGPRPVEAGIVRPEPRSRDDGAVNRRGKLVALHHQVFLTIRNEVVSGRYHGDGSPQALPGEHELASRFRVSRATVRRALASLESDGLVVRRHGVGTFAAPAPGHVNRARPVEDVFDGAQELVDGYEREVIEFREVEPPHFLLEIFPGIGSPCIYLCMLARRDGEAVHLMHQYVPRHQAARVQEARRARVSMLTLLRRHAFAGAQHQRGRRRPACRHAHGDPGRHADPGHAAGLGRHRRPADRVLLVAVEAGEALLHLPLRRRRARPPRVNASTDGRGALLGSTDSTRGATAGRTDATVDDRRGSTCSRRKAPRGARPARA